MMTSVILEAVNALLEQHSEYMQRGLELYLARHYPEIPESFRAPVVVAATAGARQAALMHNVWEKNVASLDHGKRQFAAGAASSLSFWALGMLPEHRSGSVFQPRDHQAVPKSYPAAEQSPVATSSVPGPANETTTAVTSKVSDVILSDVALPVPLESRDREFEELMMAQAGHNLVTKLPAPITPIHVQLQSVGTLALLTGATTSDGVQGGFAVLQQANAVETGQQRPQPRQVPDVGDPQSSRQNDEAQPSQVENAELTGTPVLEIHAASDIESDGGEVRHLSSVVAVSLAGKAKVSAGTKIKSSVAPTRSSPSVRPTPSTSSERKDRKREPPYQRSSCSPHWQQSRSKWGSSSRPSTSTSYTVDASEYRKFQDYMRQSRNYYPRK